MTVFGAEIQCTGSRFVQIVAIFAHAASTDAFFVGLTVCIGGAFVNYARSADVRIVTRFARAMSMCTFFVGICDVTFCIVRAFGLCACAISCQEPVGLAIATSGDAKFV